MEHKNETQEIEVNVEESATPAARLKVALVKAGASDGLANMFVAQFEALRMCHITGSALAGALVEDAALGAEDVDKTAMIFCQMIFAKVQIGPDPPGQVVKGLTDPVINQLLRAGQPGDGGPRRR